MHTKELSKNMKFQEIILAENRKLSRHILALNQALYDETHTPRSNLQAPPTPTRQHTSSFDDGQFRDLKRKYELA
jgi:hypothetical protein